MYSVAPVLSLCIQSIMVKLLPLMPCTGAVTMDVMLPPALLFPIKEAAPLSFAPQLEIVEREEMIIDGEINNKERWKEGKKGR